MTPKDRWTATYCARQIASHLTRADAVRSVHPGHPMVHVYTEQARDELAKLADAMGYRLVPANEQVAA